MSDFNTPPRNKNLLKAQISIPASPFLKRLGYGTGVSVYNFVRSPKANKVQSPWAIKKVMKRNKQSEFAIRLQQEADVLRKLDHPNIVGFRAFTEAADGTACLAMEKCEISLQDYIEKRCEDGLDGPLEVDNILKVVSCCSKALDYLHNRVMLLHGDVKSGNVLVQDNFKICKLCDFGVCLPLTKDGKLDKAKEPNGEYVGTGPWNAPEVLNYPQNVTTKADIFALGITIWEMLANSIYPHSDINNFSGNEIESSEESSFESKVSLIENDGPQFGKRPPLPEDIEFNETYHRPLELFFCCTMAQPDQRPSALLLSTIIDEMRNIEVKK